MKRKIIGVTVGTTMNPKRIEEKIENGKSAYELAVQNGFKGTEIEWLDSLHGKDGKDGKDAELVQELGNSEDKAISQKVVTSHLTDHTNRITNLEQKLDFTAFVTDDSVAYAKTVPANTLPYAEVNKIGGMTRKCANLLDLPETVEFTTVKSIQVSLPAGTYMLSYSGGTFGSKNQGAIRFGDNDVWCGLYQSGLTSKIVISKNETVIHLYSNGWSIQESNNVMATVSHLMLNAGETALPYEPYFEGLRSAEVTEIESMGANLIPFPYADTTKTDNGITWTVNADGTVTADGTATGVSTFTLIAEAPSKSLPSGEYFFKCGGKEYITYYARLVITHFDGSHVNVDDYGNGNTFTLNDGDKVYVLLRVQENITVTNLTFYPMLYKGGTAKPYTPYFHSTHPIPEAVKAIDGYGWGINESVYNYVDFENKQFVKRVGCVDLGTLSVEKHNTEQGTLFRFVVGDIKKITHSFIMPNILCAPYTSVEQGNRTNGTLCQPIAVGAIDIIDNSYSDAETFKAAMSGVMLYYELAEPIITDISDILPDGNYIEIESGGTITMLNEYEYAVPSEITYQVKRVMT